MDIKYTTINKYSLLAHKNWLFQIFYMVLALNCQIVHAQVAADGWVLENIHGPSQVGIVDTIAVDINQDGLMDVVSASIEDGHIRVYLNQGNLAFNQRYISTDVPGAFRVSATDFNNDGEVDFLIPSIETQEIIVLIANPSATETFGYKKQIIASGVLLPNDAQAGDFNNDGLMDVASISFEENLLLMHTQTGSGEFDTTIISESSLNPRKLVVEDFNNDQLPDILLASAGDNSVRLFSNNQSTEFIETLISDQLTGIRSIATCDIDNNGYPGFVAGVTDANQVLLFSNDTSNGFNSSLIDDDLPGAESVSCADIDADNELEIISISRQFGHIYTLQIFGPLNKMLIANSRDGYISATATSLTSEPTPIILTQAFFEHRNLTYSTSTSNQETVIWQDFPDAVTKVLQSDINQDGTIDILAASFRDNRVQWYDGLTNEHHIIAENIDGAADLVTGDFDQDGLIDVVTAASFANRFYWHKNLGNGYFDTQVLFDNARFANSVITADINSDGLIDVIGTSGSDDSVRWFEFNGVTFEAHLVDDSEDAPNDVVAGDIDGDGDVDLVVANFFSGSVSHYINSGQSEFSKQLILEDKNRPYAVLLYPSIVPGLLNVTVTLSGENEVWLAEQQQPNVFKARDFIDTINNPRKLAHDSLTNKLYISSPDDQQIYQVKGFPDNNQAKSIVGQYPGVSDVTEKENFVDVISGSFDINSIIKQNNDLIFSSGF